MPRKKIYDSLPEFKTCPVCGNNYSLRPGEKRSRYARKIFCTSGCALRSLDKSTYRRNPTFGPRNPRKAILVIGPSIAYLILSKGQCSLIDADMADILEAWNWSANYYKKQRRFYAIRNHLMDSGKHGTAILLHRQILNAPDGTYGDHINRNTLDNRRANLRVVNEAQNVWNTGIRSTNTSGYKGVRRHKDLWRADITVNGKKHCLGYFKTAPEADQAYKEADARLRKW